MAMLGDNVEKPVAMRIKEQQCDLQRLSFSTSQHIHPQQLVSDSIKKPQCDRLPFPPVQSNKCLLSVVEGIKAGALRYT